MSTSQSSVAIQDVLSSIRRLVSEDLRTDPRRGFGQDDTAATPPDETASKLVLTRAFRVADDSDADVEDALTADADDDADYIEADAETDLAVADASDAPVAGPEALWNADKDAESRAKSDEPAAADAETRPNASLEETIAELEAAVAGIGEVFEPDGSEVSAVDEAQGEAEDKPLEFSFSVEDDEAETAEGAEMATADGIDAAIADGHIGEGDLRNPDEAFSMAATAADTVKRGLTLRLGFEDDDFSRGRTVRALVETGQQDAPAFTHEPRGSATEMSAREAVGKPADAETGGDEAPGDGRHPDRQPEPAGTRRVRRLNFTADEDADGPDDAEEAVDGDHLFADAIEGAIDREALRALVSEIIRQELRGALGERITCNVRKLVRREVYRALAIDDKE